MSSSLAEVYRQALRLDADDRRRLADYLTNPPPLLTAEQILATLEQHREALHELGVERIGLFGSFRRGEADQGSDIDLLVRLRTLSFFTGYMRVLLYLEEVFGRPVDLVLENSVREELRRQIMDEVLYAEGV